MNKYFFSFLLLICGATGVFAQEQAFLLKEESKNFDVKVKINSCDEEKICSGEATVYLMKKNQTQIFQTIEVKEMYLTLNTAKPLNGNLIELKSDELSGVTFADYNFDAVPDLVLSNGNYKPYGGISYDVFLFSKAKGKFVKHEKLTELESENMIVEIKTRQKYIEATTKSGCCFHETTRYKFVGNRLVKIYAFTEDAMRGDGKVRITTERLVGKKWRTTTKVQRIKD